jgi:Luciferase-like monooxygenase
VLGVPYRPPAIVAKMAETLDRLSGGRLILGLGGGYSDAEFRAFGLTTPTPTPREKVDGLEEAIQVIRGLWAQPGFSFPGRLYRTEDADLEPKPAPYIPIWLGTFGDRALRVTGRHADGWIPSLGYVPDDDLLAMRRKVLAARGGNDQDFTCALNLTIHVGGRPDPAQPELVAGSAEQIAERLRGFIRAGFNAFNAITVPATRTSWSGSPPRCSPGCASAAASKIAGWRRARCGLLADAPVDPLAQQIGVTEVAGVLLDHVEDHLAQRDGRAVLHGTADAEIG